MLGLEWLLTPVSDPAGLQNIEGAVLISPLDIGVEVEVLLDLLAHLSQLN
jgi:hypothetical protein